MHAPGYRRLRMNDEVDRAKDLMIYKDARNHSYYRMENGRSAANNPIDVRKIRTWLRNPADGRVEGPPIRPSGSISQPLREALLR